MKALILAGGLGTRLRPLTCTRPKILFPIINKPLLGWIFEKLADSGINEVVMAVNRQTAFYIRQERMPKLGIKVKYSVDPPGIPLGTAGPLKKAEKLLGRDEPFLVLNGDIYTDMRYTEIIERHDENKADATIALYKVENPSRYGVAELEADCRITRFIEKPCNNTTPSKLINAGIYVLSPRIFQYIPKDQAVSMERQIFPIVAQKGRLFGHAFHGLWRDIGKPEEYLALNMHLLESHEQLKMKNKSAFTLKQPAAFGKGVTVGKGAVVGPYAIVGRNVSVGKNVRLENSIVFPDVSIADGAVVSGAIVGQGVFIGENAKVSERCVLGDLSVVKNGVTLAPGCNVCPGKEVDESILDAGRIT